MVAGVVVVVVVGIDRLGEHKAVRPLGLNVIWRGILRVERFRLDEEDA